MPSIRTIRARLHLGQPRAQLVRAYLQQVAHRPSGQSAPGSAWDSFGHSRPEACLTALIQPSEAAQQTTNPGYLSGPSIYLSPPVGSHPSSGGRGGDRATRVLPEGIGDRNKQTELRAKWTVALASDCHPSGAGLRYVGRSMLKPAEPIGQGAALALLPLRSL